MRLFRLGRVARALHRFLESSFALLFLMLSFYMVVAHWFACIWYVIGMEDLKTGINFGWLSSLATITKKPFYLGKWQFHKFYDKISEFVIFNFLPFNYWSLTFFYAVKTLLSKLVTLWYLHSKKGNFNAQHWLHCIKKVKNQELKGKKNVAMKLYDKVS